MSDGTELDDLDAQLLAQMRLDFLEESQEHLDRLNLNLTRLEANPNDKVIINEIFRTVHTLKGTASFVGLDQIREVSHKMEDVFGAIRKGELTVAVSIVDTMFECFGILKALQDNARADAPGEIDIRPAMEKLVGILACVSPSSAAPKAVPPSELVQASEAREPESITQPQAQSSTEEEAPSSIAVCMSGSEVAAEEQSAFRSETIRVATERLDNLMNLVGELITNRNRLNELAERLRNEDLAAISAAIHRLTGQMHSGLMSARMVPMERLFNKFPSVVRGLARENAKEVELIIEGKETELDKTIIEQIHDPLVHLLRNAVSHGIEPPDERRRRGKPSSGRIRLASSHHQDSVIIEVADDGQGIDSERVIGAAVRKSLITREEAHSLSHDQALRLIFTPGLSTAEVVSDVAGRGVGLDVVKDHVQKLRGMIDVGTEPGRGTTFRIQMPLTLAILQVLLVKVDGLSYGLPLGSVSETLLVDASEIKTMERQEVIFIRGKAYALKQLSRFLRCGSSNDDVLAAQRPPRKGLIPIVVVGLAEKRVALWVDELLGKQEVVMKPLGDYLGRIDGIEGASILADGSVTVIVDIAAVLLKNR